MSLNAANSRGDDLAYDLGKSPCPYEGDYQWPENLYDEMYDMGVMASFAYTMGYIVHASRQAHEQGVPFVGLDFDPNADTQKITKSSAIDCELNRSFTPAEMKEIVVQNKEFLVSIASADFQGDKLERLISNLDKLQARVDASGIERALALEEFDDTFQEDESVYGVARDSVNKRITIIFRGTEMGISKKVSNDNWLANANIFKKTVEVPAPLKDKLKSNKLKFHRGFYGYIFNETVKEDAAGTRKWDQILADAKAILAKYPDHKLYVTGHSLGAALSTICAFYLACEDDDAIPKPVTCVNFASPRAGGWKFAHAVHYLEKNKQLRMLRSVNENDIVTTFPATGYYHVGHQVTCYEGGRVKNIEPEILYMNPTEGFFQRWWKYRTNSVLGNLAADHGIGIYLKRIAEGKHIIEKKSLNQMYIDEKVF